MKDIQGVFEQVQEEKKKQKEIRKEYRDSLVQDEEYQMLKEKLEKMRDEKKQLEAAAQRSMGMRWDELENSKDELKKLQEMASDIALTTMMNGDSVEVRDEYDTRYEPVYTVTFKKAN